MQKNISNYSYVRVTRVDVTNNPHMDDVFRVNDFTRIEGSFYPPRLTRKEHDTPLGGAKVVDGKYPPPDFSIAPRVMATNTEAVRSNVARCHVSISSPQETDCEITLQFSRLWLIGTSYPAADNMKGNRMKWQVKLMAGSGLIQGLTSKELCSSLYYEAMYVQGSRWSYQISSKLSQTRHHRDSV
jgi:hypothetical protein